MRLVSLLTIVGGLLAGCGPGPSSVAETIGAQRAALARRTALRLAQGPDPADLTPLAREVAARARAGLPPPYLPPRGIDAATIPHSIRLWRRSRDNGSDSCAGEIEEIELERYVKGVLPHEWIPSWEPESHKAGSVAIRTYASYWIANGGKYDCADLDDTTRSQVYKDDTLPNTDGAVDATRGELLLDGDAIGLTEYSAENGDPTKTGVDDPVCAGKELFGHGRGMCQWGSQRWALQGKDYRWIARHYYPHLTLVSLTDIPPDAGVADLLPPGLDQTGNRGDLDGGCCAIGATEQLPGTLALVLVLGGCLALGRRRRRRR